MTFTVQEVPDHDLTAAGLQMYDFTLNDILTEQADHCMQFGLIGHEEVKLEDPFNSSNNLSQKFQASTSSMLASPSMNMPVLCEAYNPYMQSPQNVRSLASPSNTYAHSPGDSNYSVSPIESPQEDFMRYVARQPQPFSSAHVVPQSNDYGFYYNDCMAKRRQRDNELTADEYEKRRLRRERNKMAALRCRNRRRERIEALEQETSEIEAQNEKVQIEITKFQSQIEELKDILKGHNCQKNICGGGAPSPTNQQQQPQQQQQQQQQQLQSTSSEQVKVKPEPE